MKRILALFVVLFFTVLGFGSTGNACEEIRKNPALYERLMRVNAKEIKELGDLELVAVTPVDASSSITYLIVKSELAGEMDLYIVQEVSKNCRVKNQNFYTDRGDVRRIIRNKRLKKL